MASWFYGPKGEAEVHEEKPEGWFDHPSEVPVEEDEDDAMGALRKEYKAKFGKKPFGGWDEETLRAKLEE